MAQGKASRSLARWSSKRSSLATGGRKLQFQPLEERRLLHAGHDHEGPDPGYEIVTPAEDLAPGDNPIAMPSAVHPLSSIPALNSLPGAAASIYLDFDGHFEAAWGTYSNISSPAFDRDGDPTTFSDSELANMQSIWAQVSEDYAPFNINVTTVLPASFANKVAMRIVIGGDGAWRPGVGGVAYVNSFTSPVVNTAWVFSKNLSGGNPKSVAEAASHEAGHTFGLEHQSAYNASGTKTAEYYAGAGDGRAPIMGNSYSATRGLWWFGTSSDSATAMQDDMAIISRAANGFGYRPDDHGNTTSTATQLSGGGSQLSAQGIIAQTTDVDYFKFDTGSGLVTVSVQVPTQNNLDSRLELRNAAGALIASAAPTNSFGATLSLALDAGTYYAVVASQGNYGDVGQYTLVANVLTGSINGTVYQDSNHNGIRENDELPLAGWTVFDDFNNNGQLDATPTWLIPATQVPLPINDVGSVNSILNVQNLYGTIVDINVRVNIPHANTSNLFLVLTSPDGLNLVLVSNTGGPGAGYIGTTFDDQAATTIGSGSVPFTGSYKPSNPLSNYNGRNPNGNWKLLVSDLTSGATGVLEDWSLEITTNAAEPSRVTDSNGNYQFGYSDSGSHHIRVQPTPGHFVTSPASGVHDVFLSSGLNVFDYNFGIGATTIVQRGLFYNQSKFDGNNSALNASDDAAIATDKVAYLPSTGPATFDSISSYSRGINGLYLDILALPGSLTTDDFVFKLGADNTPDDWTTAPAPTAITVRAGAGVGGADRVSLSWADGAIANTWLEVTVLGNATTGLSAPDTFYFGNVIGNSGLGDSGVLALTSPTDELAARSNPGSANVINPYDFNRDGFVTPTDQLIARSNTGSLAKINLGTLPGAPQPMADDGLLNALASSGIGGPAAQSGSAAELPRLPLAGKLGTAVERWLHDGEDTPRARAVVRAIERVISTWDLQDELLDLFTSLGKSPKSAQAIDPLS